MGTLHEHNVSLWIATTSATDYPRLAQDIEVDVAVIGAGITGLTAATLLKRAGARVALIEADRVASGATGSTTAKVTSLHGLMYHDLMQEAGHEQARLYGEANQAAIEQVAQLIEERIISCDFRRAPAYTYGTDPAQRKRILAEVEACQKLDLPATFAETTELPFPIHGAIRFDDQAMFHPRKYCLGLAEGIPGDGSYLFELTRVTDVTAEETSCTVMTELGEIHAGQVILATQIPFLDRGGFFARTSPSRSYALAVEIDGELPDGMYLAAGQVTHSVRSYASGDLALLIVVGEGHKVGQDPDTRRRYEALETWTREHFPVRAIPYRWSAQDYMPLDNVPYIGQLTPMSGRIFVATGFKKWGMTNGTVAGMILADLALGRRSPWLAVFDATRMDVRRSAKQFVTANVDVARRFVGDRLALLNESPVTDLPPGEGRVVEIDGESVAAYRDESGTLHAVSPKCAHLGCIVTWNTAEKTWDCPCHGSRYTYKGRAIQGPTVKDLEPKRVPGAARSGSGA